MKSHFVVLLSGLFAASLLWSQSADTDGFSPVQQVGALIRGMCVAALLVIHTRRSRRASGQSSIN